MTRAHARQARRGATACARAGAARGRAAGVRSRPLPPGASTPQRRGGEGPAGARRPCRARRPARAHVRPARTRRARCEPRRARRPPSYEPPAEASRRRSRFRVSPMDRDRSAQRIERDIETLAGPEYTLTGEAIRRYAYTPVYRNTLDYFTHELEAIGFEVSEDAVGTLFARNRPPGEPVFGVGSHCDSNRNGGKYDGTMGVVTALEVCRLNAELGLDLPLQLVSFLEEAGSGFGQMLLGSRIVAQRVTEEDLREKFRALDDGRSFWESAAGAGYAPEK